MDPNETLAEMRRLAASADPDDMDRLSQLVEALDDWLRKGGFLPRAWERDR